jgi:hypothetical protein
MPAPQEVACRRQPCYAEADEKGEKDKELEMKKEENNEEGKKEK